METRFRAVRVFAIGAVTDRSEVAIDFFETWKEADPGKSAVIFISHEQAKELGEKLIAIASANIK